MKKYTPPTPAGFMTLRVKLGLSRKEIAGLIGQDLQSVKKYEASQETACPFPALAALFLRARGITITPGNWREEVKPCFCGLTRKLEAMIVSDIVGNDMTDKDVILTWKVGLLTFLKARMEARKQMEPEMIFVTAISATHDSVLCSLHGAKFRLPIAITGPLPETIPIDPKMRITDLLCADCGKDAGPSDGRQLELV